MISISANVGQTVGLAVQVLDSDGYRTDGYSPSVDFILAPSGSVISGFPALMTNISIGVFKLNVNIPKGISAVGTYIASVSWIHPTTLITQYELFLINAGLPFGTSSVSPV